MSEVIMRHLTIGLLAAAVFAAAATAPAQECPRLVGRWPYGPTEVVAAGDDGTVYIGSGSAFRAVDITDPQLPTIIGELVVDDIVSSVAVELNHAYLTGNLGGPLGGVRVVDISDPHNPTQVGEYIDADPFPPRVLDAAGGHVYVAQYGDLSILDVSDPAAPALAGTWEPPSGSIRAGSVDGQVAYLATYECGGTNHIYAVDVSDPAHPMALGSLALDEEPIAIVSAGHLVYLTTDPELVVIDASNPSAPAVVGSYSAASANLGLIAVAGTTAYVADSSNDLVRIIDVSNPNSPVEVNSFPTGWARGLAATAGLCLVASIPEGLEVADVSDPASAAVVGRVPGVGISRDVDSDGAIAVVADDFGHGLRVLDVSDPASPQEIGWLPYPEMWPTRSELVGDLAYVAAGTLWIVDVSQPSSPVELSITRPAGLGSCWDSTVVDELAFLPLLYDQPPSGILALDVSNPALPYELGRGGDWDSTGIAVDGTYAYTVGTDGLHIVDVSDPALPIPVGSFAAAWSVYNTRVAVADGLAVVAPELEALHVIDVSEPQAPSELGVFDEIHFGPTDVALVGGRVLVSDGYSGTLRIIDVIAPHAPFEVGASGLNLNGQGVSVSSDLAYVAAGSGGVPIFALSGRDAIVFRDDFESGDTLRWPATVP
ncbi:MAG TPA: hypothetical protein PLS95_13575 [Thermoanaerobaculales bacterium]|nr:hypothetical protein [Thermoanaerobaculales bacterium]